MTDFEEAMLARCAAQDGNPQQSWAQEELRRIDEQRAADEEAQQLAAMLVYLAGHHMADEYRAKATAVFANHGIAVLDPMRDEHDYRGIEGDNVQRIVQGDLRDVVDCTHVLANFSQNSVGTSMECWFAHSIGRPVVSFVDSPDLRISPWVHYISRHVSTSLDDALYQIWKLR